MSYRNRQKEPLERFATKEDIEMMESRIRENVIEGELVIRNNGIIEDTIREFLSSLSGEGARKEMSNEFKIPGH